MSELRESTAENYAAVPALRDSDAQVDFVPTVTQAPAQVLSAAMRLCVF